MLIIFYFSYKFQFIFLKEDVLLHGYYMLQNYSTEPWKGIEVNLPLANFFLSFFFFPFFFNLNFLLRISYMNTKKMELIIYAHK